MQVTDEVKGRIEQVSSQFTLTLQLIDHFN